MSSPIDRPSSHLEDLLVHYEFAAPYGDSVDIVDPVALIGPYVGLQQAELVNRRVWFHADAFQHVRWEQSQTIVRFMTAAGPVEFATTVAPGDVEVAVVQAHEWQAATPLAEEPEARAWLQNAGESACIAGARFAEAGSSLTMVTQLYALGAQTVRIRGIVEQHSILCADQMTVVLPEDDSAARSLVEFLAAESLRDDGCSMEADTEPFSFMLSWR